MLRGEGEPALFFAVLVFLIGLSVAFGIVYTRYIYISAAVEENDDQLYLVSVARMIKRCFSYKDGILEPERMNDLRKIECGFTHISVCVRDILTGDEWLDCKPGKSYNTKLYVPVNVGNELHMGELSVKKG